MGQANCKPEPGDLIEIDLPLCQHWALYLGDGYVIHLMPLGPQSFGAEGTTVFSSKAKVMRELLKDVVENHTWRVNNKFDRSHTPRPVEKIILSAEQWVDKEVPYDVIYRNCEHFVTMLRYGEAISGQVRKAVIGAVGALAAIFSVLGGKLFFSKKKLCS